MHSAKSTRMRGPELSFPHTISTARLILRPYSAEDAPLLLSLVEHERARLVESFPNLGSELLSLEDAYLFISDRAEQISNRKLFCYGMYLANTGELVGQLQVKNIDWDIPSAELSYFVATSASRKGLASEAIRSVLSIAFEELNFARVFVRVIASNEQSLNLAKKLGFQHEGVHRNDFRCGNGQLRDVHYFSITDRDDRQPD